MWVWIIFKFRSEFEITKKYDQLRTSVLKYQEPGISKKLMYTLQTFLKESTMINMLLHGIFGILGPLNGPFFHTLNLMLFVNVSGSATHLLKATANRIGLLINTLFISVFMVFAYSILSTNLFKDRIGDLNELQACSSLASCFLYSLNKGLTNTQGDAIGKETSTDDTVFKFDLKSLFDLGFFMATNTIILNMVSGILTDSFGEMRDKTQKRKDTIQNTCLICQNKRIDIEESNEDFQQHVQSEHSYFLYMNFVKNLKKKDRRNLTADEVSILRDVEQGRLEWMPFGKSLYLQNIRQDANGLRQQALQKVGEVQSSVGYIKPEMQESVKK